MRAKERRRSPGAGQPEGAALALGAATTTLSVRASSRPWKPGSWTVKLSGPPARPASPSSLWTRLPVTR